MSQNKNPSVSFPSSTLIIFFTNIAWWWYVFWLVLKLLDYLLSFAFKPNNLSLVFLLIPRSLFAWKVFVFCFIFQTKKMDGFWFGDGAYRSCTSSIFHFNSLIRRYYLIILRSCIDECEFRSERSYRHRSVLLAAF